MSDSLEIAPQECLNPEAEAQQPAQEKHAAQGGFRVALPEKPTLLDERRGYLLLRSILDEYHRDMITAAYRITGDFHLAEDVAQEAFLKLHHHIQTKKVDGRLISWLRKVVYHASLKAHKKASRYSAVAPEDLELPDLPKVSEDDRERAAAIARVLATMSLKQQAVFELRTMDGLRYDEIARIVGCPADSARVTFQRVREKITRNIRVD